MAVFLSPVGGAGAQFCDNNGNPLNGGKLYTYLAGTTTPAATYTSSAGATFHTNPIILNAGGRVPDSGEIWLADSVIYKFVLKTSADVLIATWDQITGINSNFVNFTTETEVQTATAGQTVFTLTTMQYQPATGSLTVYVDGVNQYEGTSYLETDSTTVTFTAGLHVGAEVKFTTAVQTTGNATDASVVTYDPPFTGGVATNVEAKLAQTVSVKDFGAVGDGVTDDTAAIQAAVDYCIANGRNLYFPAGDYKITSTITFVDDYSPDYPFPRLPQLVLLGEPKSKIIAGPSFSGSMFYLGDSGTSTPYKGALFLVDITLDADAQEISLLDALPGFQARFYAERCNFLGVTGAGSYALNTTYSSAWLKDCVIQATGTHTTNGIGIVARYTTIEMENCFISYFGKAVYFDNFAEATVQAKNCIFQINAVNLYYAGGGYLNNASAFYGCYFVETKPGDPIIKVGDTTTFGSINTQTFIGCQFDGYNASAGTPVLDLDFGNCAATMTFIGCNVWTASAPAGTSALTYVTIGQYTSAQFINSPAFQVQENNNPQYAKFADWKSTGTDGGASSAGFNQRVLNTTVFNAIPGCSIASNVITLPIGVYRVQASAPCIKGNRNRLSLYNDTKVQTELLGSNNYADSTGSTSTTAMLSGRFAINEVCDFRLLQFIESAYASIGLGAAVSDGSPEIYSEIEIWKEA